MNWWSRPTPPFWAYAGRGVGEFRFVCDLRDGTAREVCFTGLYERRETAVVLALLKPGSTFVDVGANWGYFSLAAAGVVGLTGRVVSFEPDPRLFAMLEANVAANGFGNVQTIRAAAAASKGELQLTGFEENDGNWGLTRVSDTNRPADFTARATPLDEELDRLGIGPVDLVKMDIEGAEDLALEGMAAGLRVGRYTRLLVELHPTLLAKRGLNAESVIEGLLAVGFRAWVIDGHQAAYRRAAYAARIDPVSVLTPWTPGLALGPWPHLLFAMSEPLPLK